MADIPSKKSRTQLKLDLFMKSHSEQSQDTTEITSQKQTSDTGCTSSAIDATEDLEESMPGPSHLSNVQSKEDQTDLESSSISHYDIGNFIQRSSSLSYNEKIDILQNCWKPTSSFTRKQQYDQQTFKTIDRNKVISFQPKWFDQHKWLYYSAHDDFKGGWCLGCVLFLTDVEKERLGALVRAPFRNYNKSKELLDDHEKRAFHKTSIKRTSCTQSQQTNTESRIDVSINQISVENFKQNKALLPSIVDGITFCARQQIAFRGHRDDKVNFEAPTCNEGNFVAIIRMLAECNCSLKKHLISGYRNARYVSKTIQNEVISVYADLVREHFRQCLQKCPHFA